MINYKCPNCDNLECETSVCPVCGGRTVLEGSTIYWSKEHNTPSFFQFVDDEKCEPICSDIRPVFPKERLLIEVLLNKPMAFAGKSVWNNGSNCYIVDGAKVRVSFKDLSKIDSKSVINQLNKYNKENKSYEDDFENESFIKEFIKINSSRLNRIEAEAIDYIKQQSNNWNNDEMFVSFSGGKDSTVVSSLVMNALSTESIPHIYGDTTLEYPTTKDYIERFKTNHKSTPLLVAKNKDQDFNNLCEVIGPPSRVMRWCCTVFKTGAITRKIESIFKNRTRILSFQGIRRNESKSRSKYDRDSSDSKIKKQAVASPIIDWIDFDVWLYILTKKIDFNDAYKQGFSRVGCWCCPNNSGWSAYLSSIYMPNEYEKFYNILYDYAKKVGKSDWKEYVDQGNWKARQGGNGLDISKNTIVNFTPCVLEENAYNFSLSRPIDDSLYTLFKPFGKLDFNIGNKRLHEVYVLDKHSNQPLLKISGRTGKSDLKISIVGKNKQFNSKANQENYIKAQITKYQTCIGCSACQSVCQFDALKVINTEKGNVSNDKIKYIINENKCVGCLECVKHFDSGCYMKKVLRIKKG